MTSTYATFLAASQVPFFKNDLEVLNYALTLEHLEAEFYKQVVASGKLSGTALAALTIIRDHEITHVDALTAAISQAGGMPVKKRQSYNFAALGDISTQQGILTVSEKLEMTGVGAYNGAAREIMNKGILATAGAIVAVEARHTGYVRALLNPNGDPSKNFEIVLKPQDVLAAVTPVLGPES